MTHADIINRWPSLSEFGNDLGVAYGTAKAMRRRASIPAPYWQQLIKRAGERGINGIDLDLLASAVSVTEAAA